MLKRVKKKIIITGAQGQDGMILSKILIKKKYYVIGIVKKESIRRRIRGVKYYKINLLSNKSVFNFINNIKPHVIIHLASNNTSNSIKKLNQNYYKSQYLDNFDMTSNLINAVKNNDKKIKFIFAGSSHMYGDLKKEKINEKTKFSVNSFYSKYKVNSHQYLMNLKREKNLNITTVILFNHDSKYRNKKFLFPRIIRAIKNKNKSFLNSIFKDNIEGDFSHAYEICYAIFLLIKSNHNFNKVILSSGKIFKINDLINYLLIKKNSKIKLHKKTLLSKKTFYGDNSFAIKKLNWKIKKTIFTALNEMYT